jgi:phosphate transport system permease protein
MNLPVNLPVNSPASLTADSDELSRSVKPSLPRALRVQRSGGDRLFALVTLLVLGFALVVLSTLILQMILDGYSRLNPEFLLGKPSRFAEKAGIFPALIGSLYLMILTAIFAVPLGVGAAVYLEEYAPRNRLTALIELNIANLAAVPSIIYGLLGLQVFVRMCNFDRSLLAGALTMSLLILPTIIIATREGLRTVPRAIRDAALALGASDWQTTSRQVLPAALPTILTGCILAFSRAIGETAPLITLGALTYVAFVPDSPFSAFTALPIQAFNWVSRPQADFQTNAAAAMVVLMTVLLSLNALAIWLRIRVQKRLRM